MNHHMLKVKYIIIYELSLPHIHNSQMSLAIQSEAMGGNNRELLKIKSEEWKLLRFAGL